MSRFTSVHDFHEAGSNGLCHPGDVWDQCVAAVELHGGDPDTMQAAFFDGQRKRARRALERMLAGMTPPRIPLVEHAIEWVAQGGAMPEVEMIALVREVVPEAFDEDEVDADYVVTARVALVDYQGVEYIQPEAAPSCSTMVLYAQAKGPHRLSGLVEFSFMAGREGDDRTAWMDEAGLAMQQAFPSRDDASHRWHKIAWDAAVASYEAGALQREIDACAVDLPMAALELAEAYAVVDRDDIDVPRGGHDCKAVDYAIAATSFRVARRHSVSAGQAAACAIAGYRSKGLLPSMRVASMALPSAERGRDERIGWEASEARRRAERERKADEIFAGLFGAAA